MAWTRKPLVWGGVCAACGDQLTQMREGWHEPSIPTVRCLACGPEWAPSRVAGVGPCEDTDRALREHLRADARVLTPRPLRGLAATLDHLVIAPSGIWIIDSRYWEGRIEYRAESLSSTNRRLIVGGMDRTAQIGEVSTGMIPVARVVGREVPVAAAVVLVRGDWSLATLPHLVFNRPFQLGSVWIAPSRVLITTINEPGALGPDEVERLASLLDGHLPPAQD